MDFLILLLGGAVLGLAGVFVRLADTTANLGPFASAFWRMAVAAPFLLAWAAVQWQLQRKARPATSSPAPGQNPQWFSKRAAPPAPLVQWPTWGLALFAAAKDAGAPPLPYLLICAFIANAASFVLPISNPANLVVYGTGLPPLGTWLAQFAAPSAAAIVATYAVLRFALRTQLGGSIAIDPAVPRLDAGGRVAAGGIAATAGLLALSSALDRPLGPPTLLCAAATWIAILIVRRAPPWGALRRVSWSVLPLVAALFVLVRAVESTGATAPLARHLAGAAADRPAHAAAAASIVALAANLLNNLPAGLIAANLITAAHASARTAGALLLGIDLGPNLSVTGSLATILWLIALRREGVDVSAGRFLRLGVFAMPLALAAALGCFLAVA